MRDQDAVRQILAEFERRLRAILDRAWSEWLEMPKKGKLSARSRASVVFDFIRDHALAEFNGDPDIHPVIEGQTVKFLFRDRVLIRSKKANSKGIGSNIETQAVLEFVEPQLKLPEFLPDIFKVEICYVLNKLATKMEMVAVTKRDRSRKIWSYPIMGGETSNVLELLPRPVGPNENTPPEVRPRRPVQTSETSE
jgi:hypothetical protein